MDRRIQGRSLSLVALMLLGLVGTQVVRADDLKRRGLIGVNLAPLTEEMRKQFHVSVEKGVVLTGIVPNSAAEKAQLKPGDIVVRLQGETVEGLPDFMKSLRKFGAGDTVKFTVVREGNEVTADVTLNARPLETSDDYDIVYESAGDPGKRVRLIVSKPKAAGKYPAVMLIQGLGPGSVETFGQGPNPVRSLVDELTKAGFVTVRAERVGVGDSEGIDVHENTIDTDVTSFRAALVKTSKLDFVDPNKVFVFAHSSGAAIAPLVGKDLPIKGIATFAAFARPWNEHSMEGSLRQWKLELKSEEEIKDLTATEKLFNDECFGQKKSPKDIVAAHPELKAFMDEFIQNDTFIFGIHYKFMQELASLDVAGAWSKVKMPVLAIWGEADFNSSKADSELVASIVNKNAAGKGKFVALPQTDHGFNLAEDQEESFLAGRSGGTFNPAIADTLTKWFKENAG